MNAPDKHAERDPAWDAGYHAGWAGDDYDTNPYSNGSDRETWFGGYAAARDDKQNWPKGDENG